MTILRNHWAQDVKLLLPGRSTTRRPGNELEPVLPGVVDEEARRAGDLRRVGPPDLDPALLEPCCQPLEIGGRRDPERGMRLRRRHEVPGHADVQLVRTDAEPDTAAHREKRRLRHLLEPEKVAVEPSRLVLAPDGGGHLDVVEPDDHRER